MAVDNLEEVDNRASSDSLQLSDFENCTSFSN